MTQKHEIVCITRCGFNFLHGEGVDCAAKITYHRYLKNEQTGATYSNPAQDVLQERLIPRIGFWG